MRVRENAILLPEGANLGEYDVLPGCSFNVDYVRAGYWFPMPWGESIMLSLTVDQQVELATQELVLLPFLHYGRGEDGVERDHLHNLAVCLVAAAS